MDRKKPPALTSPWKVGFLVALMLVVTGIGVSYFISGTFGLRWHWIELGGIAPSEWKFQLDAFIDEMVPLIALIALLSTASYLLVSGAVRRYKKFVDSGADYKQVLHSIKTFDDLEDPELLESLKQQPELREFLVGLKNRTAARERQAGERDKRTAASRDVAEAPANLPAECSVLVHAITDNALSGDLGLSIPELKQIEGAVRERLSHAAQPAPAPAREPDPAGAAAIAALDGVRGHVQVIRRDADACTDGAHEMEELLATLKQTVDATRNASAGGDGLGKTAHRMDLIADTLATLGEDTRRIAIAAALNASGGDTETDPIKVAEDIRTIATRFNGVSQQWKEAGPVLRSVVDGATKNASATEKQRAALASAATAASSKASLWSERLVALMEQIRGLEQALGIEAPAARPARQPEPAAPDFSEIDEKLGGTPAAAAEPARAAETDPDIENGSTRPVFDITDEPDEAPFADIPGFENEQRIFTGNEASTPAADESHIEVDAEESAWKVESSADEIQSVTPHDGAQDADAHEPEEGFLTGPRGKPRPRAEAEVPKNVAPVAPTKPKDAAAAAPAAPAAPENAAPAEPKVTQAPAPKPVAAKKSEKTPPAPPVEAVEVDADAVDLYAYGAVDYVEGVHA